MADLAASDVTVTLIKRGRIPGFANIGLISIAFGNAVKTVPSAGIPLPVVMAKYGVRGIIYGIKFFGQPADGLVYQYDLTNHKLLIRQSPPAATITLNSHTHDLRIIGGVTADEDVGVLASGPTLGKLAATNRVIAGADQATKGGVVGVVATGTVDGAAAPLVAYTGAIAATVLRAIALGN